MEYKFTLETTQPPDCPDLAEDRVAYWLRETERLLKQLKQVEANLLYSKYQLMGSYQDLAIFADDQPRRRPTVTDKRAQTLLQVLFTK